MRRSQSARVGKGSGETGKKGYSGKEIVSRCACGRNEPPRRSREEREEREE